MFTENPRIPEKLTYTAYGFTPDEFPAIQTFHPDTRMRAQKTLDETAAEVGTADFKPITHLGDGSPLHVLEETVETIGADLVVLGSHGHGVVASLLLGSVAEGMVRNLLRTETLRSAMTSRACLTWVR